MTWKKADTEAADRLIVGAWGLPKSGKTQFLLTFPDPIYLFNLDWGLEHHLPSLEGREVYVADYKTGSPTLSAAEAETMLLGFEKDYEKALSQGSGTIAIDTATQLWNLVSKVFLDDIRKKRRDGQIYPFDYANANAYFQNLVNQIKDTEMNMCLVQRAREKYNASGQPTGNMEPQGNNQVPYLVQILLRMEKRQEEDGPHHVGTIQSCWQTSKIEGTELENITYDSLKSLIEAMK